MDCTKCELKGLVVNYVADDGSILCSDCYYEQLRGEEISRGNDYY